MRHAIILVLFCVVCAGQAVPILDIEVPQRKQILQNRRVTMSLLELAPRQATPVHKHDHDMLAVFVTGGHTENTVLGRSPTADKMTAGEVRFMNAGYTHAVKNESTVPFRAVTVEFADPQGKIESTSTPTHYCNPGSTTTCVDEHELFCTTKVCVEDAIIAPGAITSKHTHATDHAVVAISDYELTDQIEGKGTVMHTLKSGEIEYTPAGITHQLTNTGQTPAHFIVIVWR